MPVTDLPLPILFGIFVYLLAGLSAGMVNAYLAIRLWPFRSIDLLSLACVVGSIMLWTLVWPALVVANVLCDAYDRLTRKDPK